MFDRAYVQLCVLNCVREWRTIKVPNRDGEHYQAHSLGNLNHSQCDTRANELLTHSYIIAANIAQRSRESEDKLAVAECEFTLGFLALGR